MKKITFLAFVCAMFMGTNAVSAQEGVTWNYDAEQGYLFNRMQDNWFIEADGGVGMMMSTWDAKLSFGKRLGLKGQLAIGKWFSPLLGVRFGGEFNQMIGVTNKNGLGYRPWNHTIATYNGTALKPSKFNNIGGFMDAMFNVTNWICGYKPGRFYNAVVYGGMGIHWVFEHEITGAESRGNDWKYDGGQEDHSRNLSARAGLLNQFNVTKNFAINLDLRFEMMQEHTDGVGNKTWNEYPSVLLGVAYKFNRTDWYAPKVNICQPCPAVDYSELDALKRKLADANATIKKLQDDLAECMKKKPEVKAEPGKPAADAPLATIYFPINVTKVVGVQKNVVEAVSEVMKQESNNYVLTGWADNYTGNDEINVRLRKGRVATVKSELVAKGVEEGRMQTEINNGNLTNYGAKCASLDRAVTIYRAK